MSYSSSRHYICDLLIVEWTASQFYFALFFSRLLFLQICPQCQIEFPNVTSLVAHFESTHSMAPTANANANGTSSNKSKMSDCNIA